MPASVNRKADQGAFEGQWAVKVFEKHAPSVSKNPMIGLAKGMTLRSLIAMPQAREHGITEEMVSKVLTEINTGK